MRVPLPIRFPSPGALQLAVAVIFTAALTAASLAAFAQEAQPATPAQAALPATSAPPA